MEKFEFEAEIRKHPDMNAAYIEFPYDVKREFGTAGRVKIQATFDGHPYRGSLAPMGGDCHLLGLTQQVRKNIGKEPGDTVSVVLQQDTEPRTVELPQELQEWLDKRPEEKEFFEGLSYTNRKEYAQWITGAKKKETRNRRLEKAFSLLEKRAKHP